MIVAVSSVTLSCVRFPLPGNAQLAPARPGMKRTLEEQARKQARHAPTFSTSPQFPQAAPNCPNPPSKTKQHSRVAVHGDNNVAGNNVRGNGITGHDNYVTAPAPIFVGPGSIGITGGTVTNPTVNNFGPPARRIRPENRDDVIAILKQKPIKIDIAYVSGDETFQFANDMYEALKEAGWRMGGFNQVVLMTPWRGVRVDYYESGGNKLPVERLVTVPKDSSAETLIKALMKAGIRNISVHPNEEDPQDSIRLLVAPYPG
jgi:hypothetical protein